MRHANVAYTALSKSDGTIVIGYKLTDQFDLSAQNGRSGAYNSVSEAAGTLYHDIGGANKNMTIEAHWQVKIKK